MCGRFALFLEAGAFADIFGCAPPGDLRPAYNIVPDRPIVAVRAGEGGRSAVRLRWGLLPPWAEAANDRGRQINARSETVFEKKLFKSAALDHRCLIPASGFYEWQKGEGPSRPYFIQHCDEAPLAMAGIARRNELADGTIESCAILTMQAFPAIHGIHHRMPVMLDPVCWDAWLDPSCHDPKALAAALRPVPETHIQAYAVSRAVNNPANDDARLIAPEAAPSAPAQGSLF